MAGKRKVALAFIAWVAISFATATVVITLWLYTPDKALDVLQAEYPADYIVVDGLRMRLLDTGPRDAPTVIMLHGFGASLETWDPWADELVPRFRVIRFDLPGFGLTGRDPTGNYSDARAMKLLIGLMNQLEVDRASLIGNSLGGRIAWNFAAVYPDKVDRLVLIAPDGFASPGFEYDRPPVTPFLLNILPYVAPRAILKANLAVAYADPDAMSASTLTRYRDMLLAPGVRPAILARTGQTILREPGPTLARIRAPTLLVWGESDAMIPISNAAHYQRHLPHAILVSFPNLGHLPFEEDPALSLPPVERFLSSVTPTDRLVSPL